MPKLPELMGPLAVSRLTKPGLHAVGCRQPPECPPVASEGAHPTPTTCTLSDVARATSAQLSHRAAVVALAVKQMLLDASSLCCLPPDGTTLQRPFSIAAGF